MKPIPLITGNEGLFSQVRELVRTEQPEDSEMILINDFQKGIDFLNIEIPELVFIDFSDTRVNADGLLDMIMSDPWLLHSGIIVLCDDYKTVVRLKEIRGANIIVTLLPDELPRCLPRIIRIIHDNRRILFQREIGLHLVPEISGHYKLNNDPIEAVCYSNLICNFLYNSNRIDLNKKNFLYVSLEEMLLNAIEHGNCGITYAEKSAWLDRNRNIMELIEQKCRNPAITNRRVTFEYAIKPSSSSFFIADEGPGFDWRAIKDPTKKDNIQERHGRGILMTRAMTRNLSYNEKGNEVRFEIDHQSDAESTIPRLFKDIAPLEVKPGDIIFRQGEMSDFVYYIVKGQYDVFVNDRVISAMSPDDVFMGEMSFLLNNQRTATVRARAAGRLIKISKKEFVQAIKKNPHYALFLSRLLAQRIQRRPDIPEK